MFVEIPRQFCERFRQSANRPHLLMGCEPTALAAALIVCVIIGYSVPNVWGITGAITLFIVLRHVLHFMASEDPLLITVHHNSQRYRQGFWTAKPRERYRWRSR